MGSKCIDVGNIVLAITHYRRALHVDVFASCRGFGVWNEQGKEAQQHDSDRVSQRLSIELTVRFRSTIPCS